ncbi:truncated hemoglobin [Oryzobacter terrae]|uniref:truncated hemoglobin n=1 Tax=Oryzobacter terrae TaxID=1620385 RepID=UPI00366C9922
MSGVDEPGLPTLYEWAGGLVALRRMIERFYDRVEADDELSGFFPGGVSVHHRAHVAHGGARCSAAPRRTPSGTAGTRRCCATTSTWPSPPRSGTGSPPR